VGNFLNPPVNIAKKEQRQNISESLQPGRNYKLVTLEQTSIV
jgi:hypothetical protein